MVEESYWRSISELSQIAVAAASTGYAVRMRGSAARSLRQVAKNGTRIESLFDCIPPLSNIDMVIPDKASPELLRDRLHTSMAVSRFFYWDIRTETQQAQFESSSSLQWRNTAEILFTSTLSQDSDSKGESAFLQVRYDAKKRDCDFVDGGWGPPEVIQLRDRSERVEALALADLLHIRRVDRQLIDTPVVRGLTEQLQTSGGGAVRESLQGMPERRVRFAFTKYLIDEYSQPQLSHDLLRLLGTDFLQSFASRGERGDLLTKLSRLELEGSKETRGLVCTVVPRLEVLHGLPRWVRRVEDVNAIAEEGMRRKSRLEFNTEAEDAEAQIMLHRQAQAPSIDVVGPPARLYTDDPPDPGCCRFRDFERGVAELVWVDSRDGAPGASKPGERFAVITDGESTDERATALSVGHLGQSPAASLRCDYNFLCVMAGSSRAINLYRVGELNAD